jgi:signal transduction histidine kinase
LRQTIDTELRMGEIVDACERIAALLAGVKQYSQMDRGAYQSVDIHELLRSTGVMFGDRIAMPGKGKPVTLVKDLDHSLPEILCYPGDLNQVWTAIFDNALQAMDGLGTLTIRTRRDGDAMIRLEIRDDGPGIPTDVIDRVFTPFFTTKPRGAAAGLGLDLARRIVVDKHQGTISVQSEPGDTRFIVCLPLRAPAPKMRGLEDG